MKRPEAFAPIPKPEPRRPARPKPLPWRSPKRKLEAPEREHVRLAVVARDRMCIAILVGAPGRCASPDGGRPSLEVHERKTRARGGSTLNLANCAAVCQRHHDWIDEHQPEAHGLGLLLHSWEPEPMEPLTPHTQPQETTT